MYGINDLKTMFDKAAEEDSKLRLENESVLDLNWGDGAWDCFVPMEYVSKEEFKKMYPITYKPLDFGKEQDINKVYLLMSHIPHEGNEVVGVYANETQADFEKIKMQGSSDYEEFYVKEFTINE